MKDKLRRLWDFFFRWKFIGMAPDEASLMDA
jgi:hypothetical protein